MLKQSPGKNQRPKGFKVKHVLQICVLLVICIWLLYQLKHSHDEKATHEDSSLEIPRKIQNGRNEIIKLGRRDVFPLVKDTSFGSESRKGKEDDSEEETERRSEDGQGIGDDEVDGHDQERAEVEETEGVEDLIDEEDRERDEGSEEGEEEEEEEEKGIDFEDVNEEEEEEGKSNILGAREGHYEKDDASGSVMQNMQTMSGSLRKVQEKEVESENRFEVGKETEIYDALDFKAGKKDSETKVHPKLRAQSFDSENAERVEEIGYEFASSRSDDAMYSTLMAKAEASKVENNSAMLINKGPTFLNGGESYLERNSNPTPSAVDNFDPVQKVREVINGSQSISSEGTLQFDASDGTEKSTYEHAASSGQSKDVDNR